LKTKDSATAQAFSTSWNNLPLGSIYTVEQFLDWFSPLSAKDVEGKNILEMGCGNGSLMIHLSSFHPLLLTGIDLGDSVITAEENLKQHAQSKWQILKADMVTYTGNEQYDLVYCIGVLHHLKNPRSGFNSIVRNTKPGGLFHCWVYAHEGNSVIRFFVDPIRKIACRLPWYINKYFIATPLVVPYFLYAKTLAILEKFKIKLNFLPLYEYSLWIARRSFLFFRHVAFDQLVTPQTLYIKKNQIQQWLSENPDIDQNYTYIIMRNGNSWKFGGRRKSL